MKTTPAAWHRRIRMAFGVPYCAPAWGWAEHWAIAKCLVLGRIVDGKDIDRLRAAIREKTGVRHAFGYNSGREAIWAALSAAGVGDGDRVIMPSYCCETVAMAVVASGAEPVFCDIDEDLNPDVNHILRLINDRTRAVVFPHLFGKPGAIDTLEAKLQISGLRDRIFIIDDAAQSFGARINGRLLGTFGDCGIVSFGPGKTMTATGGGLLLTGSDQLAQKLQAVSTGKCHVIDKIKKIFYWVVFRRWRKWTRPFYRFVRGILESRHAADTVPLTLCNLDAAVAVLQLKKLDAMIALRSKRRKRIDDTRKDHTGGALLSPVVPSDPAGPPADREPVFTKYVLKTDANGPDGCRLTLLYRRIFEDAGIEIFPLYEPIHLKARYRRDAEALQNTERLSPATVQVPLEPSLSAKDFDRVIDAYRRFMTAAAQCSRHSHGPNPSSREPLNAAS